MADYYFKLYYTIDIMGCAVYKWAMYDGTELQCVRYSLASDSDVIILLTFEVSIKV